MKESTVKAKKSRFSPPKNDISEIEKIVDRILLKNEDKLSVGNRVNREKKQDSDETENDLFDVKIFSPDIKKRDSIYFVKNKQKPVVKKEKKPLKYKKAKKSEVKPTTKTLKNRFGLNKKKKIKDEPPTKKIEDNSPKIEKDKAPKKHRFSQKEKPISILDESIEQLTTDEAKWLDKQIEDIHPARKEKSKDILYDKEADDSTNINTGSLQLEIKKKPEDTIEKKDGYIGIEPPRTEPLTRHEGTIDEKKITSDKVLSEKPEERKTKLLKKLFRKSKDTDRSDTRKREKLIFQKDRKDVFKKSKDTKKIKRRDSISTDLPEDKTPSHIEKSEKPGLQQVEEDSVLSHPDEPESDKDELLTKIESDDNKPSSSALDEVKLEDIKADNHIQFVEEANNLKSTTLKNLGYSEGSWEELDFYPLTEPFAYVQILREKETLDKVYVLSEVGLTKEESQILEFLKETISGLTIDTEEMESKGEWKYLNEKVENVFKEYMIEIDAKSKKKILYFVEKKFIGLSKLEVLMRDPNIEDISCDGSDVPIFLYHRRYGSVKSNVTFDDEEELSSFVIQLAQKCGKHISIAEPMLDATMPDGSRVQMTLSTEVTTKGSTFTIRKFREDPFSPPDLIEFNTMSSEMVAYLWMAVENGINALIAGGTAAGKTSTLNAVSLFIPSESKIVSIEETREINLPHPNWIPGISRSGFGDIVGDKVVGEINMYDLMKAALRQRPEYILVGEIRGREAYVLFQAMATGHTTYSTVHADSAQSLIYRLEGKPINIPRIMLQALDVVCIQVISRVRNKRARRCKQIIEIIDIDPTTKEILTNEVFRWDPVEDKFVYSGKSYVLERIRGRKDLSREKMTDELKERARLLEWMNNTNIREFKKVATLIAKYTENPEKVLKKIKDDA